MFNRKYHALFSCFALFTIFLNCILMTWFTLGLQIIVITWHLKSWQCGIHKDVFSAFQKLQNLESFDELLINQVMMKMTPELRWTFPACAVDRICPALRWCAWWYQYCGNSQFIINCFQATQKQRRNIDNGRVMVVVTPASRGPDINIETFEHNLEQHEIWRLYIIVNFNDSSTT